MFRSLNCANKNINVLTTTAISYPNGKPHIGHLYESIIADIICNVSKMRGLNSKLLTGTDEHGKKIQTTAEKQGITPKELCDINSEHFKTMNNQLNITPDRFIRTTDQDHKDFVKDVIEKCKPFISKELYTGYYNIREESYITEREAIETDYKDPVTGILYEQRNEESYKFNLPFFLDFIKENLHRVKGFNTNSFDEHLKELQKLTITRLKSDFTWGIDFPFDDEHIVYVWFDALLNYYTGLNSMFEPGKIVHTTHVIGKDIVRFHSVIYPAILAAANLSIYDSIYVHGFIVDNEGRKMSKSLGNVISPDDLFNKYTVDQIRFYLFYETRLGEDIKFNEERLVNLYNEILIGKFLNMFQRVYKLISDIDYPFNGDYVIIFVGGCGDIITQIQETIDYYLSACNESITNDKPWRMNSKEKFDYFSGRFANDFYNAMIAMSIVLPEKVKELNSYMGLKIPTFPLSTYHYDPSYKSFTKISK